METGNKGFFSTLVEMLLFPLGILLLMVCAIERDKADKRWRKKYDAASEEEKKKMDEYESYFGLDFSNLFAPIDYCYEHDKKV